MPRPRDGRRRWSGLPRAGLRLQAIARTARVSAPWCWPAAIIDQALTEMAGGHPPPP